MKIGIFDHLSLRLGGAQLVVAYMAERLAEHHDVEVIHSGKGYSISGLAEAFAVDLSSVNERIVEGSLESFALPGPQSLLNCFRQVCEANRALTAPYDLFIYSGHGAPPFCYAKWGLVYSHFPFQPMPSRDIEMVGRLREKNPADRWIRLRLHDTLWTRRLSGYQRVLANSQFTAGWIERLWGTTAEVLYPPVSLQAPPLEKQKLIVSLGRFICTDTKGHASQLNAFRAFLHRNPGDWELCLMGFCTDLAPDRKYLAELQNHARDLPVGFMVNAKRNIVVERLAQAKLFWHTTGLPVDDNLNPRSTEHFGIATVEAMRAGCVPLVPRCGGQLEIVDHEVCGYLCNDMEELVTRSSSLARLNSSCADFSQKARDRSKRFLPESFERSLQGIVHQITNGVSRSSRNLSTPEVEAR